jgi:site-specific DNA-methyltransferase (adenine-specific)
MQTEKKLISKIEYCKSSELREYENNARTHSAEQIEQIAASIREFGFTNPILIDEADGIIAGHGRVLAARKLGMEKVPCIRLGHLTEAQRRAYVIADNKLALNAGWDDALLRVELEGLQSLDFDTGLTGFSEDEIAALLAVSTVDPDADPDETPQTPVDPVSVLGDIWALGKHRVMCGDSINLDAVTKLMDDAQADLLLTDPPYNVAYEGKTAESLTIKNDSMADGEFRQFLRDVYTTANAVMKPGAVFYIWHADSEGYNFRGAAFDVEWKVRQCLIWKKSSMVLGRQDYQWKHEPCLYGWKEGAGHFWGSDRKQTTVLEFDKPNRNGEHPTMKPVELFQYQVENSSKPGGVVLDLFGGSGTTLVACEMTGRIARLMELDPKYADVIVQRWQNLTGKEAVHAESGETFNAMKARKPKAA